MIQPVDNSEVNLHTSACIWIRSNLSQDNCTIHCSEETLLSLFPSYLRFNYSNSELMSLLSESGINPLPLQDPPYEKCYLLDPRSPVFVRALIEKYNLKPLFPPLRPCDLKGNSFAGWIVNGNHTEESIAVRLKSYIEKDLLWPRTNNFLYLLFYLLSTRANRDIIKCYMDCYHTWIKIRTEAKKYRHLY